MKTKERSYGSIPLPYISVSREKPHGKNYEALIWEPDEGAYLSTLPPLDSSLGRCGQSEGS